MLILFPPSRFRLFLSIVFFTTKILQAQTADWLIDNDAYQARVEQNETDQTLTLSNGLISRQFLLKPDFTTLVLKNEMTNESLTRGIKPEAEIEINGHPFTIGGLKGQPNYAFWLSDWKDSLYLDTSRYHFRMKDFREVPIEPTMDWKRSRHHDESLSWPPRGVGIKSTYESLTLPNIEIAIHYELYDGIPVIAKWLTVKNKGNEPVLINRFTNEILAAIEYESRVETRGVAYPNPHLFVTTDYAFGGMTNANASKNAVHWEFDPEFTSQVNYLKETPCLLKTYPALGPAKILQPGQQFSSFRTYVMAYDSYDRERMGLAERKFYRYLAPWTTENPLMMHVRYADWETVKNAIDQAAAVGFEMVILTFGSGFNMENDSLSYLEKMKGYAAYATSKGVEIGGYSLLASRSIDAANDVVMPEGQTPTYGHSPCLESQWGIDYFKQLYHFFETTGFQLLEHDGNYPGDVCISTDHPGHNGYLDSQWEQWEQITSFYNWCREKGIYLNVPDFYYLNGSNKCGMGYREVNWSLPRAQQVIHTRQNIYDGTWQKIPSMGWMFVPLTEYHGGGAAATIEPLKDHLQHYQQMLISNLGAGVQACYRGPRLFDTPETKALVKKQVGWYKQHRAILESDIIHLRRPDGRDLDYWLHVNPKLEERGALLIYNPTSIAIKKEIKIPLYYTGLSNEVVVFQENQYISTQKLDRQYSITLETTVSPGETVAYFFRTP